MSQRGQAKARAAVQPTSASGASQTFESNVCASYQSLKYTLRDRLHEARVRL